MPEINIKSYDGICDYGNLRFEFKLHSLHSNVFACGLHKYWEFNFFTKPAIIRIVHSSLHCKEGSKSCNALFSFHAIHVSTYLCMNLLGTPLQSLYHRTIPYGKSIIIFELSRSISHFFSKQRKFESFEKIYNGRYIALLICIYSHSLVILWYLPTC